MLEGAVRYLSSSSRKDCYEGYKSKTKDNCEELETCAAGYVPDRDEYVASWTYTLLEWIEDYEDDCG